MSRKLILVVAAIQLTLLSNAAIAQRIWKNGTVEAKADAGFAFMAEKRGFATKMGIELQTIQFKGDAIALKALIAGELDSYEGSPGAPMIAMSRGADVRLVGCYWPVLPFGIVTKANVTSPTELKGKSFGISSPGSLPDLFARAVLEKYNVNPNDVQFAALGGDPDRYRALSAGVLDVAAISSEYTPSLEKLGLKVLIHARDVTPKYLRWCTYMTGKTITTRGADAVAFIAAEIQALRFAFQNKEEYVKVTREMTNTPPEDIRASFVYDEVLKFGEVDPEMPILRDNLEWMKELFVRTGTLTMPLDLDKFIDATVRDKALVLAGPPPKS